MKEEKYLLIDQTIIKYHFTPTRMATVKVQILIRVGKGVEISELSSTAGDIKMVQTLFSRVWQELKMLKIVIF